jgi:hypothetical protein
MATEKHTGMSLKEIRCEDVDWINLAQDRVRWRTHGNEPSGSKDVEFLDKLSNSYFLGTAT